ncbi:MAG TPA: DJ-1/PfpI family protein [Steroidobacteraceae bacterium]|jgi:putative intracellular protease/amidase|nr:DJ-1/PfpI family protein [Steroidobacteraceae bacterium]
MRAPTLAAMLSVALGVIAGAAAQEAAHLTRPRPPKNLAILIFPGVQIIDYTGPWETFGHAYVAGQPSVFNIYTVAEKPGALTTNYGMEVTPRYTLDNAPKPDVMVIPGGDVPMALNSTAVMKWVEASAKGATLVMSVCNGAFILAKAGLLDGLEATTTAGLIEQLKDQAPRTNVVSNRRFVDNGKIITTAGLSSGIDGSLHVLERLYGRGTAQMAALAMEYNWDPEARYARAALADKYMPSQYDVESVTTSWVPLNRTGGLDRWESTWTVGSDATAAVILSRINDAFPRSDHFARVRNMKWTKEQETASSGVATSLWRFSDEQGNPWRGTASVESVRDQPRTYLVRVAVMRLSKRD